MNIVQISFLLGHEQLQTTMVYLDITAEEKAKALATLGVRGIHQCLYRFPCQAFHFLFLAFPARDLGRLQIQVQVSHIPAAQVLQKIYFRVSGRLCPFTENRQHEHPEILPGCDRAVPVLSGE